MPFGEEFAPDATYRTANLKYGAVDRVRQKFTTYQRDEKTQLDFAEARYYNNNHGRFTAAAPFTASANVKDPQTFNRYSYAMNSPYKFTDPLGLVAASPGNNWEITSNGCGADSSRCSDNYTSSLPVCNHPKK